MPGLVIDCSVSVAVLYPDEADPSAIAIMRTAAEHGALVPSVWPLEMANTLRMSVRRGRLTEAVRLRIKRDLEAMAITIDDDAPRHAFDSIYDLAETYELTVYDAAYLELARRERCSLATLDQALRRAATRAGVALAF
jgi:predicted nucleic acid-binding protein